MRQFQMLEGGRCLPGMSESATRATWPVWSGSTTARVRFAPVTKQEAAKLYHRLRDFERQTRQRGRQDGRVTRNGLAVAHALLFDFLNFRTGQLDPAYGAISRAACISIRSVARGLQALKAAGVLNWIRRCAERVDEAGRFSLEQESNAYAVCPPSQWQGYQGKPEAPPPDPESWGAAPVVERGTVEAGTFDAAYERMELDARAGAGDVLAAALARIGRALDGRNPRKSLECQPDRETRPTLF